jgi:hypothetical protein
MSDPGHLSSQIIEHIKDHLHDVGIACPGLDSKYIRIKPEFQPSLLVYMYAQFNFPKTYIWI